MRHNTVTIEEAGELRCPQNLQTSCFGPECMAWVTVNVAKAGAQQRTVRGYCGMISLPKEILAEER